MAKGERNMERSPPTTKSDGSIAAKGRGWGVSEFMVMLESEDKRRFLMSEAEARRCGRTVHVKMKYDYESHTIPTNDGSGQVRCYRLVRLSVQGDVLSKVIDFSKTWVDRNWADTLVGLDPEAFDLNPANFFDLILAADYLRNQKLLDVTCPTVAHKIHKMSPYEIRKRFNIRTDLNKDRRGVKPSLDQDRVLTLSQNALKALHVVRCQSYTAYDPKRKDFICTRFCSYNIAFFNLEKESILAPGPPPDKLDGQTCVQSAVNVISLKITDSDVGKKFSIFGTVIARDQVDYRCLVLFKRGEADAQTISLRDGMLTLTTPCRALVLIDEIIFEMDLKIKHHGGHIEDFSRGVICLERARLPTDEQTMTLGLNSWLSRVELTCAHVVQPVEATIAVSILKGPCNISRVAAWTFGNREDCIILYDGEGKETQTVSGIAGGLVPLSRSLVAVPVDTKLVLHLVGDDIAEQIFVTAGQSDDQFVCKIGLGEVQVKVSWTCIVNRKRYKLEVIGNECLLH